MHPILRDMLTQPVGWLTICGALVILGIPLFTVFFIRRRMREEQRGRRWAAGGTDGRGKGGPARLGWRDPFCP